MNVARSRSTGQGALVDYLSLTIAGAEELIREIGEEDFAAKLLRMLFGKAPLTAGDFTGSGFQGYSNSAVIIGPAGTPVGRVGAGGNNDTLHVSISGSGCEAITDWQRVQTGVLTLGARITRCDLAFDDYLGDVFNPRALNDGILAGDLRIRTQGPGQPPKTRFIDDHGYGTGVSLYAGRKGHKELCIYEKGKQLGDFESPWVRCEVRFWAKRANLPVKMLTDPLAYLRAAYNVCEEIPADVCERIKTMAIKTEANAVAHARWVQTQMGKTLHLFQRVLGDGFDAFCRDALARPGVPARFKGISDGHLIDFIKEGLGRVGSRDPLGALA